MRLPNGYGSVYKLKGNRRNPFVARKTVGWKDNGQPMYHYIGYYASKKEAVEALVAYNKDPYDLQLDKMTFEDLYAKWSDIHYGKIKEASIKSYKTAFKVCAPIMHMRVVDIKLGHLQEMVDHSGKNTPSLKDVKILLGLMYDYAVIHEVVGKDKRDMITYLDISKPGNPNSIDREPFTDAELQLLWSRSDNDWVKVVLIMIYSGVRIGELLDLKKEDVHLDEEYFFIKSSKTSAGIREVPIAKKISKFVHMFVEKDGDYLISSPSGRQIKDATFRKTYWGRLMEDLGIDHRPHDTRHTCISLLVQAGVDERIIRKIVGHKGYGVTETVYTHADLPHKLEAINMI